MRRQLAIVVTVGLAAAPALALDLPLRKAGLWELKMVFVGRNLPPQLMKQCTDASTDRLMNLNFGGSNEQACSKHEVRKSGDIITVDAVCKFGEATTTSHAVVTGSFDSAYTIAVSSRRQGGPQVPGVAPGEITHMTIDGTWLGPCAAGQKPGDVVMANGVSMNVLDLQKMRAPPKQ